MDRTPAQKQQYVANVVKGNDTHSTVHIPLGELGEGTDTLDRTVDNGQGRKATQPSRKQRSTSRDPSWWEKNKGTATSIFLGSVGTIVVGVVTYIVSTTLVGLNREVAQLQQGSKDISERLTDVQKRATRSDDRLDTELRAVRERLEGMRDRIEAMRDHMLGRKAPNEKKPPGG